jgi:hypothetical protein
MGVLIAPEQAAPEKAALEQPPQLTTH